MSKSLEFTLALDSSKFVAAARNASGITDKMGAAGQAAGQKIEKGFAVGNLMAGKMGMAFAISNKALELAGRMMAGLTEKTAEFFKKGIESAGIYEDMTVALKSFTSSADLAADASGKIADFTEKGLFNREETEKTAKALLQTGSAVSSLGKDLDILGNLAAASGKPIDQIGEKMLEMQEKGEAGIGDLMPLIQGGIPIFEALAKVMNLPIERVKFFARENRLSLANVKAAFNELAADGGRFSNAMNDLGNTTQGKIKTLSGAWETLQRKVGEPLNDMLKPILDTGIEKVKIFTEAVVTGSELIRKLWENDQLGDFTREMMSAAFKEAGNVGVAVMKGTAEAFYRYIDFSIDQLISAFTGGFNDAFVGLGQGLWGILKWVVGNTAAGLIDGFARAGTVFSAVLEWSVSKLREQVEEMWESAKDVFGFGEKEKVQKAGTFEDAFRNADHRMRTSFLGEFADDLRKEASASFKEAVEGLNKAFETWSRETGKNFKKNFEGFGLQIEDVFGAKENLAKARGMAEKSAPGLWGKIGDLLRRFVSLEPGKAGPEKNKDKESSGLAGATGNLQATVKSLADGTLRAAEAAIKLATALKDSAAAAALASGKYNESARLEQQKRFDERKKTLMEGGMSEAEARKQALADSRNAAKIELAMRDPRKAARMERANERVLKRMSGGGVGVIDGVERAKRGLGDALGLGKKRRTSFNAGGDPNKYLRGLSPAELAGLPMNVQLAAPPAPAVGKGISLSPPPSGVAQMAQANAGLAGTVASILSELQIIRTQIGEVAVV